MVTKAKILITGAPGGAQGATAGKIVEMALDRGIPIAAFVRNHDDRSKRLEDLGAEIVIGDLLNLQDVISATSGRDTVFFCFLISVVLSSTKIFFVNLPLESMKTVNSALLSPMVQFTQKRQAIQS